MNDLDLLRTAANLIRERANRAAKIAPGEWYADQSIGVYAHGGSSFHDCPNVFTDPGTDLFVLEHIAGFGPEVAVLVADWLDSIADRADADGITGSIDAPRALDLARAYLAPTTAGSN